MLETIKLIHTNDLHSHFEVMGDIQTFIQNKRQDYEASGIETIYVDVGDCCDRSHPLTEATNGQANIAWLNETRADIVTIGNNEGLGNAKEVLMHLYDDFHGTCTIANLYENDEVAPFAQSCVVYQTKQGHRIGFIGLTAPFPMSYSPLGWTIKTPDDVLPQLWKAYRDKVDAFVLLSHLGIDEDRRLAAKYPWLTLIVGGHTHHLFKEGEWHGDTLLVAAQKYGAYIGEVTLLFDKDKCHAEAKTYHYSNYYREQKDNSRCEGYQLMQQSVGKLTKEALPEALTAATLDTLLDVYQCDVGALNTGLFLKSLQHTVTKADLHQCLPHPMHVMVHDIDGDNLQHFLFECQKNRGFLRRFEVKGMGFRGKVFGELLLSGDADILYGHIDKYKKYRLLTLDHYYFVPFFPTLAYNDKYTLYMDRFLREVVAENFAMISQRLEGE